MNSLKSFTFESRELGDLIQVFENFGYTVIGPIVRGSAIIYGKIKNVSELPVGWGDEQSKGRYRLKRRTDDAIFGWTVGPQSWKKFLFPPIQKIVTFNKKQKYFRIVNEEDNSPKYAFLGVRPCELSAIAIQDKVYLNSPFTDEVYESRRKKVLLIAVNCGQAGGTCFCPSLGTGPKAEAGFDIALTEVLEKDRHYFVAEIGTELGSKILSNVNCSPATEIEMENARLIVENTRAQIIRTLNTLNLKNNLYKNIDNPVWDEVAEKCLGCANCTMVCPTCFCNTVVDTTDLKGNVAERIRRWDSCFTLEFSYVQGGNVRTSIKSRYRQWVMHKFAYWMDQFGAYGCVGCGRCITWCPVGIDIVEKVKKVVAENDLRI